MKYSQPGEQFNVIADLKGAQVWLLPMYAAYFKMYGFLYRLLLAFFSNEKPYFIVKFHQI